MSKLTTEAKLAAWIEPEIAVLEIDETQGFPFLGADASIFPDCARS